ncbi:MAG: N-acetylmuramic acid 6-phosphate etherase [Acidobacteriota bacterium]
MQLKDLKTERRNPKTENLDEMSALEIVTTMNREDSLVPRAIRRVLPQVARAVEVVVERLGSGGRLFYVGAGTSGRIGALDASECAPTFGIPPSTVQCVIAGGEKALVRATESSEDSADQGRIDIAARKVGKKDVVVGIAASGYTPYTIGALKHARSKGAATIAVACNGGSDLASAAQISIEVDVGPEVLTGSSRLKAGTAQKMICNMISTAAMAKLGYVYSNLMINMRLKNRKLRERGLFILETLAEVDRETAQQALERANMDLSVALVMLKSKVSRAQAARLLRDARGNVRKAGRQVRATS